jgi:hypothetical protein
MGGGNGAARTAINPDGPSSVEHARVRQTPSGLAITGLVETAPVDELAGNTDQPKRCHHARSDRPMSDGDIQYIFCRVDR